MTQRTHRKELVHVTTSQNGQLAQEQQAQKCDT